MAVVLQSLVCQRRLVSVLVGRLGSGSGVDVVLYAGCSHILLTERRRDVRTSAACECDVCTMSGFARKGSAVQLAGRAGERAVDGRTPLRRSGREVRHHKQAVKMSR